MGLMKITVAVMSLAFYAEVLWLVMSCDPWAGLHDVMSQKMFA